MTDEEFLDILTSRTKELFAGKWMKPIRVSGKVAQRMKRIAESVGSPFFKHPTEEKWCLIMTGIEKEFPDPVMRRLYFERDDRLKGDSFILEGSKEQ